MSKPRIGSLCSGAGMLDRAVEEVFGAETVWHCETDPAASKVLAHRWPRVPNFGDLAEVNWGALRFHLNDVAGVSFKVDIVTAGWPCQPWSAAGKQLGTEDDRAIWPEIARAIRILRPRIICLENVPTVIRLGELQRVADSLSSLGYDLRWTCLRASDVGAPHRRERLFIVAHAMSDERNEGWPEPARLVGGPDAAFGSAVDVDLLPTPRTSDTNGAGKHGDGGLDLRTAVALLPTPIVGDAKGTRNATSGRQPGSQHHAGETLGDVAFNGQWGKYGPAIDRWESLTRPAPGPTEPNTKGNPRLNPAFSEWLMGWPAGWVTNVPGISRNDQLRIIGNGVVPQCAAAALSWLLSLEVAA